MPPAWDQGGGLLNGPLLQRAGGLPFSFTALLCDLRPRFIPKGQAGRGYRAIARNGRVLLVSPYPLDPLIGRTVRGRLQVWHRVLLPGDPPAPSGLILWLGPVREAGTMPIYAARLARAGDAAALALDVGGGSVLAFDVA